jgi:hypothetical protein
VFVALPIVSLVLQAALGQPDTGRVAALHADSARDTARQSAQATRRAALEARREIPLTAALLASAYDGLATRSLINLARLARAVDDSAIRSYDDNSVERFSVWLQIGSFGRERLLLRRDRAERVRWQRGLGALVDVTGSRFAMPMIPSDEDNVEDMNEAIALPYAPGRRTLALGGQRGADTTQYTEIDDIIDPLAPGAEAYYRYTLGDSETVSLPSRTGGQHLIRLREIQLHPRRPIWNIAEGSLWFDAATGHLVRAVYRFAAPMDIVAVAKDADPSAFKDVPFWVKPMIMPMTASLDAVTLEYGLLDGRYWLPIARYADGNARVNLFRARVRWEVRYHYASVNGPDTLPRLADFTKPLNNQHSDNIPSSSPEQPTQTPANYSQTSHDTARAITGGERERTSRGSGHLDMRTGAGQDAQSDSAQRADRVAQCGRQKTWDHLEVHDAGAVRVYVRTPCDSAALARSPALPPSIYDPGETTFDERDATALLARLGAVPEPDWAPQPIQVRWGLDDDLIRYNRIEGLSAGAAFVDQLGLGLSTRVEARLGEADLEPEAEAQLTRTSSVGTIGAGVYRRLVSANDWGDPFTVGSSVWNLLSGDDEGFYYRAWGGELLGTETGSALPFSWRLFAEREWTARVRTRFSFTDAVGGAGMSAQNLSATAGTLTGLSFGMHPTWGTDPNGLQATADIRGEGAGGSYSYIRGAADLTVLHPVTRFADAALTAGGGTSAGDVPAQRFWYLGGLRTIRGIAPGQEAGDAYWMAHAEVGTHTDFIRPLAFYDIGWAGDRVDWSHEGRPLSGAGIGASILDGLIRFDVARGLWPTHGVRVNAYWQGTL